MEAPLEAASKTGRSTLHKPAKILFVFPSLNMGGAERATLKMLSALDRQRFEPVLVTVRGTGPLLSEAPEWLRIIDLGKRRMRQAVPALRHVLETEKPEIVFSILEHTSVAVAWARRRSAHQPVHVVNVQNSISRVLGSLPWHQRVLLRMAIARLYVQAEIVVLSEGARGDLVRMFPSLASRTTVIYNAAIDDRLAPLAAAPVAHPWFAGNRFEREVPVVLAVGRLVRQKGFDLLLHAFASVLRRLPARLVFLGEGGERKELERMTVALGLRDSVQFLGLEVNPYRFMARCDLFVLSSRWEGLANVLIEALACGAPSVATDCLAGPSEIISHGADGLLVPPEDPGALSAAMISLLENKVLARSFSGSAVVRTHRFHVSSIADQFHAYFGGLLARHRERSAEELECKSP